MSFAPGIRLELRQQQSLVLTPQLQQAIKLLQMSNLELAGVDRPGGRREPVPGARATARRAAGRTSATAAPPAPSASRLPDATGGGCRRADGRRYRAADCALALKRPAGNAFDDDRSPLEARLTRRKACASI